MGSVPILIAGPALRRLSPNAKRSRLVLHRLAEPIDFIDRHSGAANHDAAGRSHRDGRRKLINAVHGEDPLVAPPPGAEPKPSAAAG